MLSALPRSLDKYLKELLNNKRVWNSFHIKLFFNLYDLSGKVAVCISSLFRSSALFLIVASPDHHGRLFGRRVLYRIDFGSYECPRRVWYACSFYHVLTCLTLPSPTQPVVHGVKQSSSSPSSRRVSEPPPIFFLSTEILILCSHRLSPVVDLISQRRETKILSIWSLTWPRSIQ